MLWLANFKMFAAVGTVDVQAPTYPDRVPQYKCAKSIISLQNYKDAERLAMLMPKLRTQLLQNKPDAEITAE